MVCNLNGYTCVLLFLLMHLFANKTRTFTPSVILKHWKSSEQIYSHSEKITSVQCLVSMSIEVP